MNISLTDDLKHAVDEQVAQRGYGSTSEYVRELIRRDVELARVRELLLAGSASDSRPADEVLDELHAKVDAARGG